MKRFLSVLIVIALAACMLTGCAEKKAAEYPTSEEIRKIVPEKAEIDLSDYPLLSKPAPTMEDALKQIPAEYHTFTFNEKEWVVDTGNAMELDGLFYGMLTEDSGYTYYVPADGSKDTLLTYDTGWECYELHKGSLKDEDGYTYYNEYFSYDTNNKLDSYTNNKTGFQFSQYPEYDEYEITLTESNISYCFTYQFDKLEYVSVTNNSIYDYFSDMGSGYCFTYYPEHNALRDITYDYFIGSDDDYESYTATYDNDGMLEEVNYYTDDVDAYYDGNYQLITDDMGDYSFFDYIKDIYF